MLFVIFFPYYFSFGQGKTECNAPDIPNSSIQDPLPIYNFGDTINVTCDTESDWYVLQCDGNDVWRGNEINCSSSDGPRGGGYFSFSFIYINLVEVILLSVNNESNTLIKKETTNKLKFKRRFSLQNIYK